MAKNVAGVWPTRAPRRGALGAPRSSGSFSDLALPPSRSQVITEFCKEIGADGKMRQNLIRIAKNNGGRLGFLA